MEVARCVKSSSHPVQASCWTSFLIVVRNTALELTACHDTRQVDASPTRRYGGSGLGLAISQKLAEAMGGRMWAQSGGIEQGTTFRWTMACRLAPEAEPAGHFGQQHARSQEAFGPRSGPSSPKAKACFINIQRTVSWCLSVGTLRVTQY